MKKLPLLFVSLLSLALVFPAYGNSGNTDNINQVFTYIRQGKWPQAEGLAKELNNKALSKIVLSQKFLDRKYSGNSFEEVIKFLRNNPEWPQNKLLEERAEGYINSNTDNKIILAWFDKHRPLTGKGYKFYALAASRLIKDQKILLPIIREAWIYGDFSTKEEQEYYTKWNKYLTLNDHVERIDEHLWKSDIRSAEQSLKYVNEGYRNSFKAQIAIINKAANAEKIFKNVPEKYYSSGLLYHYLNSIKTQKPTSKIITLFKKAKNNQKHFAKWCRLQSYYAREFIDYKDFTNSYKMATLPFAACSETIREQEWLAGWLSLSFLKKPDQALIHFNKFIKIVKTPISLSRGFYWLGRTYDAKGKKELANQYYLQATKYSYTFYGQAANIELNKTRLILPANPAISLEDRKNTENNDVIKALKLLVDNKNHLAITYCKDAIKYAKNPAEILIITNIIKNNNIHHTVSIAKIASQYNTFILDYAFPTPYQILNLPVEAHLTYSIIRQESVFDHSAVSSAKAMGLMQLIKNTACDTAKSINTKCEIAQLTTNPLYNIKLGSHHLKKLLNDHNGSYILSIASYNAGSHKVVKWIDRFGDPRDIKDMRKIIDWIELIPYAETRNYVQRVIENMQVYRSILNKNSSLQFKQDLHASSSKKV